MRISVNKNFFFVAIVLLGLSAAPLVSLAQSSQTSDLPRSYTSDLPTSNTSDTDCVTSGPGKLCNPLGNIKGFCGFIKMLFVTVGTIAVPIAVLFLVYAGLKFVLARGNPTGLEEAKKNLFYTILGIAIFFAAWLLALAIGNTLASFGVSVIGSC